MTDVLRNTNELMLCGKNLLKFGKNKTNKCFQALGSLTFFEFYQVFAY